MSETFRVALDLRGVSHSEGGHRRLINLVRELDVLQSPLEFELICDPSPGVSAQPWSNRTHRVPPRLRTRMMHQPALGYLRKVLWGKTRIMHFLTGDVWYYPTCKTVVTLHDLAPLHFPEFFFTSKDEERKYQNHLKQVFEHSDVVLTVSDYSRLDIEKACPQGASGIRRIYQGVDPFFVPEDWGIGDRALFRYNIGSPKGFLLYAGGFQGWKNLKFLLEAYRIYHDRQAEPRKLVLVGDPHKPYLGIPTLYDSVCRMNLQQDVILLGSISDSFLRKVYCTASLFLYPSRLEGFGYSPLEAMACGCPVLCSNETSLPEVVGDAARLLPVSDPLVWAEAIPELLDDQPLRKSLVGKGFEQSARYRWEETAQQVLQVYLDLLR